jgi:hypothetical protein
MPTADVVEKGTLAIEFDRAGDPNAALELADSSTLVQYGLMKGVELGFDVAGDGDENSEAWNAKVRWEITGGAVALGFQNAGNGLKAQPFLVGFVENGTSRVHSGLIRLEGKTELMLGYDVPLGERFTFMADYTSGSDNAAGVGLCYCISDDYELSTSLLRNNSGDDRFSYDITLSWYPL